MCWGYCLLETVSLVKEDEFQKAFYNKQGYCEIFIQTLSLEDDANHLFALNQKPTSAHTILDVLKIIKGIAIMPFSPLKDLVALAIAMFELCFTCLLHFVPKNKVHVFACDPSCIF